MSAVRAALLRLASLLGRRRTDEDMRAELESHLELQAAEYLRRGATPVDARRRALVASGGVTAAVEASRDEQGLPWLESLYRDVRYTLRGLRRAPTFTAITILTLALAIGATTAIFSVVNAVLLRPLPFTRPDRLVSVWESYRGDVASRSRVSAAELTDWRAERSLFSGVEAYDEANVTVSDRSGGTMVRAARVTPGFLPMLGVAPRIGGGFIAEDELAGGVPAVLLSDGYWRRQFAADAGVVGRVLVVNGAPAEIRGVLPPGFTFAPAGDADLWLPIGLTGESDVQRSNRWLNVVARLRDGVSVEQAQRRMDEVMRTLAVQYPETNGGRGATVAPIRDEISSGIRRPLLVLFGAVALMLAIACANVASLVLARSIERGREIALRAALGASRARLMRQLVTESLVLSVLGAAAGLWAASGGVRLLVGAMPAAMVGRTPALRGASVDFAALAFTILVAAGTAVSFGLAPAVLVSRRSAATLIGAGARTGAGRAQHRLRDALVTAEVALTLVLLVGAALMGRSMTALLDVDPGFRAEHVATARVALAGPEYADAARQQRLFEELLTRVRALPGVQRAGAVSSLPLQGSGSAAYVVEGGPALPVGQRPEAVTRAVGGDYFGALGIPVLQGRALDARDDPASPRAVVVNAALVRRMFDGRDALSARLRVDGWGDSTWAVVGVVGDVRTGRLDEPALPTIYFSHLQRPSNRMSIVARTSGDAEPLVAAIRREIHAFDPSITVYSPGTMAEQVEQSPAVSTRRYPLVLLGSFAVVALVLAVGGVYGVIAYAVSQRTREIAIRMALGAGAMQVVALVMRGGLRVIAAGVVVGSAAALAMTRTLSSLLYGVSAADGSTYVAVAALLVLVGALASYLPARRAVRLDPATALRSD